jgi:hypothetical protein
VQLFGLSLNLSTSDWLAIILWSFGWIITLVIATRKPPRRRVRWIIAVLIAFTRRSRDPEREPRDPDDLDTGTMLTTDS